MFGDLGLRVCVSCRLWLPGWNAAVRAVDEHLHLFAANGELDAFMHGDGARGDCDVPWLRDLSGARALVVEL